MGSKSSKFGLDFPHQSPMTHCGFETEQNSWNVRLPSPALSDDDSSSFRPRHYTPTLLLPIFTEASNVSKNAAILAFKALQFRNKATRLQSHNRNESDYDRPLHSKFDTDRSPNSEISCLQNHPMLENRRTKLLNVSTSAADCSISLRFGVEFEHMTREVPNV